MSTERALYAFYAAEPHERNRPSPHSRLKRTYDSVFHFGQRKRHYPSPPMSRQSSPPFSGHEPSINAVNEAANLVSTSSGAANLIATTLPAPPHAYPATAPPPPPSLAPHGETLSDYSSLNQRLAGPITAHFPTSGVALSRTSIPGDIPTFAAASGSTGNLSARSGRKSKAHVASACINCKRAHLSCDVQRPCARCVASGKQDTCYDVQHKKRGRPRLREESDFKIEQMLPQQPAGLILPTTSVQPSSRPIATPRDRRSDSLRSLRSYIAEGSSSITPGLLPPPPPPPPSFQPPLAFQQPPPMSTALIPSEIPTAFLDVDLFVLRANGPFQQIMSGGQDVKGRYLGDVAAPADNENFQIIRNRLRAEREEREPTYMPPIGQSGLDPIQGVSEGDVERLTHGFDDHSYTWTRSQLGQDAETFPARVRLAKALAYFVVVTLPSFRPTGSFAMPQLSPRSAHQMQAFGLARPPPSSSVPPPLQPSSSNTQSYLPSQRGTPYQPPILPSTPQLSVAEPPVETPLFQPRSTGREDTLTPASGVKLAPITSSPIIVSEASGPRRASGSLQQGSSSDAELDEPSPKRRRVGIPDVLQH